MSATECSPSNGACNIYHESQTLQLCALHALNNLMQKKAFTKRQLDDICTNLSPNMWINPHRSIFGLGQYDINIIMAALQMTDFDTVWFDKRKGIGTICPTNIFGFIVNIPSTLHLGAFQIPLFGKHWVALRQISGTYYNLDSKLSTPLAIGDEELLCTYLDALIHHDDTQLLLVVEADVAKTGVWERRTRDEDATGGS